MKIRVVVLAALAAFVFACNTETGLEELKAKRDGLKKELAEIEKAILNLDTLEVSEGIGLLVGIDTARIGVFVHKIDVQGNIETDRDVLLNAESGGLIRAVMVKEGQRVSKGQVLVQIDADVISSSIQEVQTAIEFAEYNYSKQKELFDQGLGSEFQLQQAKNNLDNLKSRMSGLKTQKGKFVITAPFDGVVDQVFARVGAMAGPQAPVLRLVDNREIKVLADVSERLYSRLNVGMPIDVQIPSLNDSIITMSISQIGNYIHPTNRTFRVQALLKNNRILLPNMLARMTITDYTNTEALIIPSDAVLRDRNNLSYVFVAQKEKGALVARRMDVSVVESFDGLSEIKASGGSLKPGMTVVVKGARGLSEGDLLRTK
jgi:membrane fusion protein (multidrug efflux system)